MKTGIVWNLLAQLSREETFRAFNWRGRSVSVEQTVVVILSIASVVGLVYLAHRLVRYFLKSVRVADSRRGLFETLVHQHRLTSRQEKLLKNLAAQMGMQSPAALFVRKSLLERELSRRPDTELRLLMRKLFGPVK